MRSKYGDPKGEVSLCLEINSAGTFSISVNNWGSVLPEDLQQNLFFFFQRTPQSLNERGWGLGLAVVKELVDAHHGSIEVVSTEKNGTSFIVRLPIENAASAFA